MSNHVTLCLETSQGLIYLGAAANLGFQPPSYYENQTPEESVRRVGELPAEPWQVLGEVYYNVGQSLYEKNHNEEAKLYLESSLEICPEYVTAPYLFGSTLKYLGDKMGARKHYLKALEINPNYELARKAYDKIVSDQ
jgi:tetratricopeptide (TPR) repeat protein